MIRNRDAAHGVEVQQYKKRGAKSRAFKHFWKSHIFGPTSVDQIVIRSL